MTTSIDTARPEIPDRDTPDAVVLLLRLARAHPSMDGEPFDRELIDIAGMLNARLPADRRVRPDDPRLREPVSVRRPQLARFTNATLRKYTDHPDLRPTINRRVDALSSLLDYFTWSHAQFRVTVAAMSDDIVDEQDDDVNRVDDIVAQRSGFNLYWLASLCPVIDGWEELALVDGGVDACLAASGSAADEGSHRSRLNRVRQGVLRFAGASTPDDDFRDIGRREFLLWATELESEFERFFRGVDLGSKAVFDWARHGLKERDPAMRHPLKRPRDPSAAREGLMGILLDPDFKSARGRWTDILLLQLGFDSGPWIEAIVDLRDTGMISADEAIHLIFEMLPSLPVGEDDPETDAMMKELERIEQANGIEAGDPAGEAVPEWKAADDRLSQRTAALQSAYLRLHGATEAADLLDRSFDDLCAAAERGSEEYERRWPETTVS